MVKLLPPLKWAGGKRWLVEKHLNLLPTVFGTYIEPFAGSAAVFFALEPQRAIIGDSNKDLIEAYQAIADSPQLVSATLKIHQRNHSKDYYYRIRSSKCRTEHTKAARFLYLNRTCWNGLYRVNKSGSFNVPVGTKTTVTFPSDDFDRWAALLAKSTLICSDFEAVIDQSETGDLVFADPPYTILHNFNGFIKYNEKIFSWLDQIRLKNCLLRARDRGVKIILTNADHPSIRDIYSDVGIQTPVKRASTIAGGNTGRGVYGELIVTC